MNFIKIHYKSILNKYAYHRVLLCLLGKYDCKNYRNETFLEDMNVLMTELDYSEALKAEFYM